MSFSFGFTNEDFSDDELEGQSVVAQTQPQEYRDPLDQIKLDANTRPKLHELSSLLGTLTNVRLTFDNYTTGKGNIIYRRELFDIKHQVMMEEDENNNEMINDILVGENKDDLKKDVYEGGFKSWECSYDSVDHISEMIKLGKLNQYKHILELGCGTALPTCFLLLNYFNGNIKPAATQITLSDFNYEVLRLVTLPNILIHWASTLDPQVLYELSNANGSALNNDELLITPQLITHFESSLHNLNINLQFISGAWSNPFIDLLPNHPIDFLITSETIYSPESLPILAETILAVLSPVKSSALVAAKNIYFGVGGSVIEFVAYLQTRIATLPFVLDVLDVDDTQLKRSIVCINTK